MKNTKEVIYYNLKNGWLLALSGFKNTLYLQLFKNTNQ
jgi:hypothetical protein